MWKVLKSYEHAKLIGDFVCKTSFNFRNKELCSSNVTANDVTVYHDYHFDLSLLYMYVPKINCKLSLSGHFVQERRTSKLFITFRASWSLFNEVNC